MKGKPTFKIDALFFFLPSRDGSKSLNRQFYLKLGDQSILNHHTDQNYRKITERAMENLELAPIIPVFLSRSRTYAIHLNEVTDFARQNNNSFSRPFLIK